MLTTSFSEYLRFDFQNNAVEVTSVKAVTTKRFKNLSPAGTDDDIAVVKKNGTLRTCKHNMLVLLLRVCLSRTPVDGLV